MAFYENKIKKKKKGTEGKLCKHKRANKGVKRNFCYAEQNLSQELLS